jgi:DUF4097 and DUF4098 domain-containing protein YvlB
MNTTRIITIVCWCISALALLGLAAWFVFASPFAANGWGRIFSSNWSIGTNIETLSGSFNLVGTHNVAPSDTNSIDIDWMSGTIDIKPHDGSDIVINEFAQRALNENEKMNVTTSGNTVTIKYTAQRIIGRVPSKRLEVLIPYTLSSFYLDRLIVDTTSGMVTLSDLIALEIDINATSGGVTASNINAHSFIIDGTSGAINISNTNANTFRTNITSGAQNISGTFDDVRIEGTSGRLVLDNNANSSTLFVSITSGTQDMTGSFRNADIHSTSGNITFSSRIVPDSLRMNNTSGNINISVPNEGTISINHSSTSGRFSSDIPVLMQSGDSRFRISSTSGNLTITEYR